MAALKKNFTMEQGATWLRGFTYYQSKVVGDEVVADLDNPFDLTGCTARMQIRQRLSSPVLVEARTPADEYDGTAQIILGGPTGRVDLILTDVDTDKVNKAEVVYDLELVWPLVDGESRPVVERLMEGVITVDLNVTRDA